ncbi:hypothetical protein [Nostoc sp.]
MKALNLVKGDRHFRLDQGQSLVLHNQLITLLTKLLFGYVASHVAN